MNLLVSFNYMFFFKFCDISINYFLAFISWFVSDVNFPENFCGKFSERVSFCVFNFNFPNDASVNIDYGKFPTLSQEFFWKISKLLCMDNFLKFSKINQENTGNFPNEKLRY